MSNENPPDALGVDALLNLNHETNPSPSLKVIRDLTSENDTFILRRMPMSAPVAPDEPKQVRANRRAHVFHSLTDAGRYMADLVLSNGKSMSPAAFYTNAGASIIIDEMSEKEREVLEVVFERHPDFASWDEMFQAERMPHALFMAFLRAHREQIQDADLLIGTYATVRGTLVHDASDFMDEQSRAASFTVRRPKRGSMDQESIVENVPTTFKISMPILVDESEEEAVEFVVSVRMTGSEGHGVMFDLQVDGLQTIVNRHIDSRLNIWSESVDFPAYRGNAEYGSWAEPGLPGSVEALMGLQAKQIAAARGVDPG